LLVGPSEFIALLGFLCAEIKAADAKEIIPHPFVILIVSLLLSSETAILVSFWHSRISDLLCVGQLNGA